MLVFSRTKHGANNLVKKPRFRNRIAASAIHGNKSQTARERALEDFPFGEGARACGYRYCGPGHRCERGISLVINYDIPNEPESYVHRIGRTARAGAEGLAIAFCDPDERLYLRDIERLIRLEVPVMADHPYALATPNLQQLGGGASKARGAPTSRGRSRGTGSPSVRDVSGVAPSNGSQSPPATVSVHPAALGGR